MSSDSGQRMIAHELAHVVQQRQGPVSGVSHGGGIRVSEPGDRFERAADHAAALAVQRHPGGHDEEDVLPVQRHRSGLPLRADLLP